MDSIAKDVCAKKTLVIQVYRAQKATLRRSLDVDFVQKITLEMV